MLVVSFWLGVCCFLPVVGWLLRLAVGWFVLFGVLCVLVFVACWLLFVVCCVVFVVCCLLFVVCCLL